MPPMLGPITGIDADITSIIETGNPSEKLVLIRKSTGWLLIKDLISLGDFVPTRLKVIFDLSNR